MVGKPVGSVPRSAECSSTVGECSATVGECILPRSGRCFATVGECSATVGEMFCHGGRMFCLVTEMFCHGGRMFCHGGGMVSPIQQRRPNIGTERGRSPPTNYTSVLNPAQEYEAPHMNPRQNGGAGTNSCPRAEVDFWDDLARQECAISICTSG